LAAKRTLRVATEVDAEKAAEKVKPKTLAEAVDGGTYLEILVAQRREMIRDVREVGGPAKAALHRQIALHSKEIEALVAAAEQEATEHAEVADEALDAEAL
jgi:hypothetical protein